MKKKPGEKPGEVKGRSHVWETQKILIRGPYPKGGEGRWRLIAAWQYQVSLI